MLAFPHVDAGEGWLIFGLPPSELAVHPSEENGAHELFLMCDDLDALMADLARRGVACDPVQERGYGRVTAIPLPGGGRLGVYQPRHPRPESATIPRAE